MLKSLSDFDVGRSLKIVDVDLRLEKKERRDI